MKEDSYNPADLEKKAQAYWEKNKSFEVNPCLLYTSPSPRD